MSTNKKPCENYLFEDYRLKSGIEKRIPNLRTSGETVEKDEFVNRVLPHNLHFLVCLIR